MNPLTVCVVCLVAGATPGIPAGRVSVSGGRTLADAAVQIEKQTGMSLDLSAADAGAACGVMVKDVPFWDAVGRLADATGHRVRAGKRVALVRGEKQPAAVDGAFRVTAKGVNARADYETGRTGYDVAVELAWEPRFPVFRVDAQPTISAATDDRGKPLSVPPVGAKTPTTGFTHSTTVRVEGLTREARRIAKLSGSFTVTASPKMLTFVFDNLGSVPASKEIDGVRVTLTGFARREDRWDAGLKLEYPDGHPEFESFESWTGGNAIKLVPPTRTGAVAEESFDINGNGRVVLAEYRFPAKAVSDPKGWRLVYETPAPLIEFPVRFTLTDLNLP